MVEMAGGGGSVAADSDDDSAPPRIRALPDGADKPTRKAAARNWPPVDPGSQFVLFVDAGGRWGGSGRWRAARWPVARAVAVLLFAIYLYTYAVSPFSPSRWTMGQRCRARSQPVTFLPEKSRFGAGTAINSTYWTGQPCSQAATSPAKFLDIGYNLVISSACCNDPRSSSGFRQRANAVLIATRRRLSRASQCAHH